LNSFFLLGEKKWITNGIFADFFTVAVRTTEGKGMAGISLLLLEKGMPGLKTRPMNCSGAWASGTSILMSPFSSGPFASFVVPGTTYITMEDVKVPVENLIGKENHGFKYIMYNFNFERCY